jgi:hypothetical protein
MAARLLWPSTVFPHQPARPFRLAIAARANGQIEAGGGEGGFPPRRVAHFDRTPEFDRHVMISPEDGGPDVNGHSLSTLHGLRHRGLDPPQGGHAGLILPRPGAMR